MLGTTGGVVLLGLAGGVVLLGLAGGVVLLGMTGGVVLLGMTGGVGDAREIPQDQLETVLLSGRLLSDLSPNVEVSESSVIMAQ